MLAIGPFRVRRVPGALGDLPTHALQIGFDPRLSGSAGIEVVDHGATGRRPVTVAGHQAGDEGRKHVAHAVVE